MATLVTCPQCQKKLKVAEASLGKSVKCPCGNVFKAPAAEAPAEVPSNSPSPVTPSMMIVSCSSCESKLKVPTSSVGKKMKCSKCGATFVVSADAEAPIKSKPMPPPRSAPPAFESEAEEEAGPATGKPAWMSDDEPEVVPARNSGKPAASRAAVPAAAASAEAQKQPAKPSGCVGCLLSVVVFFIVLGYFAALGLVLAPSQIDNEFINEIIKGVTPFEKPPLPKLRHHIEDDKKGEDKKGDDDNKGNDKKGDDKKGDDDKVGQCRDVSPTWSAWLTRRADAPTLAVVRRF